MNTSRTRKEKKSLRKVSNKIGITYCITIIFYILITEFIYYNNNDNPITELSSLIQIMCFFVFFYILIKMCPDESKYVILFKKPKKYFATYILMGFPVYLLANTITSITNELLKSVHVHSVQPEILNDPKLILFTVLGAPLVEEFVFRGAILGLLRKYGDKFSIFFSALLFGLIHSNMEQFVFAFFMGLYLGFITIKTKSIWTSILLHSFANAFSSITVIFHNLFKNDIFSYIPSIFQLLIISLAIISFILCRRSNSDFFSFSSLSPGKTILKLREKIFAFIFNPGMILMLIYVIYSFIILGWIEN